MWFWADCKFSQKTHKPCLWKRKFFPTWISPWPYDPKHESDSDFFQSSSLVNGPLNVCLWRHWDSCHSGNTSAPRVPNVLQTLVTHTKMLSIIPRRASSASKGPFCFHFSFVSCCASLVGWPLRSCVELCCAFSLGHSVALTFVPTWLSPHCDS